MGRTSGTFPKGTHGPGRGDGWGGPAKDHDGDPEGRPPRAPQAEPFAPGNTAAADYARDVDAGVRREKRERAERLKDHLEWLAFQSENEQTRVTATDKLLDRLEGKARQSVELTGKDGDPMKTEVIRRVIVDPRNPDT